MGYYGSSSRGGEVSSLFTRNFWKVKKWHIIFTEEYDIIVIGAGHAGVEASLAASRMGCKVLLATINIENAGFHAL